MNVVDLSRDLHGHLAPGVALGIRMGQISLKSIGLPRGDKRLYAIVETSLCLPDGVQATTGCTPGHNSLQIEDFGKLAFCLARSDTKEAVRITLKRVVCSPLFDDWVMRKRRLSHEEEEELAKELLRLDDSFFQIEKVMFEKFPEFDGGEVVKCCECDELVLEVKSVMKEGRKICRACFGMRYYIPNIGCGGKVRK
ncbi:MAG: FmdE family protein [Candidatus Bathyarchaeia archaeon]